MGAPEGHDREAVKTNSKKPASNAAGLAVNKKKPCRVGGPTKKSLPTVATAAAWQLIKPLVEVGNQQENPHPLSTQLPFLTATSNNRYPK
jgi:hypothetical protein